MQVFIWMFLGFAVSSLVVAMRKDLARWETPASSVMGVLGAVLGGWISHSAAHGMASAGRDAISATVGAAMLVGVYHLVARAPHPTH